MADRPSVRIRILIPVLLILVMLNFLLLTRQMWPLLRSEPPVTVPTTGTPPAAPIAATPTPQPTLDLSAGAQTDLRSDGIIVLSMQSGGYQHLFAWNPQLLPFTHLTQGAWDDITPAVSPDGTRIAYASNRGGFWDLYLLDLPSGETRQLTFTPEYDGAPSWSPDGEWLAFEHYNANNLDIALLSVTEPDQNPILLTNDPAADYAPDWSPAGREVAFVSTRSGEEDVWLALLDDMQHPFTNLSANSNYPETAPAWSPDGQRLAWGENRSGVDTLAVWERANLGGQPTFYDLAVRAPTWSPDGQRLLAQVISPNEQGLVVHGADGAIRAPLVRAPGRIQGQDWQSGAFVDNLLPHLAQSSADLSAALWQTNLTNFPINPAGRFTLVTAGDITAPFPLLHDAVNEAFDALRQESAYRSGWDFLASLEDAFIPITQPSAPGMEENWLYTGRAFAVNPVLVHAGWMAVVREDSGGQTFWRIYLKARFQDGSQGQPLKQRTWDLEARYNGDPQVYEQGGQSGVIPAGYWIDFTDLAQRYGWQRLPALVNWRTYYPATRFNQFAMLGGMDWQTAMREIYPSEILLTPTVSAGLPAAAAPLQTP